MARALRRCAGRAAPAGRALLRLRRSSHGRAAGSRYSAADCAPASRSARARRASASETGRSGKSPSRHGAAGQRGGLEIPGGEVLLGLRFDFGRRTCRTHCGRPDLRPRPGAGCRAARGVCRSIRGRRPADGCAPNRGRAVAGGVPGGDADAVDLEGGEELDRGRARRRPASARCWLSETGGSSSL